MKNDLKSGLLITTVTPENAKVVRNLSENDQHISSVKRATKDNEETEAIVKHLVQ